MTDYIREQIRNNIISTLQGITISNGFKTNAGRNVHKKLKTLRLVNNSEMPFLSVCDGRENIVYETNGEVFCEFKIMVYGYARDERDPHKEANYVIGDIKKAIAADTERGELSYNSFVSNITIDEGTLSMPDRSMFNLEITIQYGHKLVTP